MIERDFLSPSFFVALALGSRLGSSLEPLTSGNDSLVYRFQDRDGFKRVAQYYGALSQEQACGYVELTNCVAHKVREDLESEKEYCFFEKDDFSFSFYVTPVVYCCPCQDGKLVAVSEYVEGLNVREMWEAQQFEIPRASASPQGEIPPRFLKAIYNALHDLDNSERRLDMSEAFYTFTSQLEKEMSVKGITLHASNIKLCLLSSGHIRIIVTDLGRSISSMKNLPDYSACILRASTPAAA